MRVSPNRCCAALGSAFAAAVCFASAALATDMTVEVRGVPDLAGHVLIAACKAGEPFPAGPCSNVATTSARLGTAVAIFHDLPGGRYALSAFHDRDDNGKLGQTWLGIPTECIGFGNGAAIGRFGPPPFDLAAVDVPVAGALSTTITLRCR
jgi:uncharacterized protein (DUF2141 family)